MSIKKKRWRTGDWYETDTVVSYDNPLNCLWYHVLQTTVYDFKAGSLDDLYLSSRDFNKVCEYAGVKPDVLRKNLIIWKVNQGKVQDVSCSREKI